MLEGFLMSRLELAIQGVGMRFEKCQGFYDMKPEDMEKFRYIESVFREQCLGHGYQEIRTPSLEYLHLFTAAGTLTPDRLNKVYSFLDWNGWSGERVVLRPDGTIPAVRFYIEHQEPLSRFFYIESVFSYDETGKKKRENWQGGVELIGLNSTLSDFEIVYLAQKVLTELGLKKAEIKLSHAGLLRSLLRCSTFEEAEQIEIFDRVLDGDSSALLELRSDKLVGEVLGLLLEASSAGFLKNIRAILPPNMAEVGKELDNLISLVGLLEESGITFQFDLTSARGFEYYSGFTFRLFWDEKAIGGGGRYDILIPLLGGPPEPAAGFALYFDPLMEAVKEGSAKKEWVLLGFKPEKLTEAMEVMEGLRSRGYVVRLDISGEGAGDFEFKVFLSGKGIILTDVREKASHIFSTSQELLDYMRGRSCSA
jgi:histidyl-tRNA synthetase